MKKSILFKNPFPTVEKNEKLFYEEFSPEIKKALKKETSHKVDKSFFKKFPGVDFKKVAKALSDSLAEQKEHLAFSRFTGGTFCWKEGQKLYSNTTFSEARVFFNVINLKLFIELSFGPKAGADKAGIHGKMYEIPKGGITPLFFKSFVKDLRNFLTKSILPEGSNQLKGDYID